MIGYQNHSLPPQIATGIVFGSGWVDLYSDIFSIELTVLIKYRIIVLWLQSSYRCIVATNVMTASMFAWLNRNSQVE